MTAPATRFREREWVAQTRGKYRGRVGTVHAVYAGKSVMTPKYVVQFGSSGPFDTLLQTSLRKATPEEIAMMCGYRVRDLPEDHL